MTSFDQIAGTFREEANERLSELESTLLELESNPDDKELVAQAFRAMHTIKGSGAMFGFEEVATFTHELETVFDAVRNGKMRINPTLISLSLEAKDLIRAMLDGGDAESRKAERARIVTGLRAQLPGDKANPVEESASAPAPAETPNPSHEQTYRVRFSPTAELFSDGTNPLGILAELAEMGACRVVAHTSQIPRLEDIDPESCHLSWDVILTTSKGAQTIRDAFMFIEGKCGLGVDLIDDGESSTEPKDYKKLGEILVERGALTDEQLHQVLSVQRRLGDLLTEKGVVSPETIEAAIAEQSAVREVRARRVSEAKAEAGSSIRVAAERLDDLVDLVGELVIAQARLSQIAARHEDADLLSVAENLDRLAAELRDNTLNIRMVPIGTTFGRFKRLVRDLSGELGKEIEIVTEGAETELDKTVIERLGDPLVHLIRNCCDHGIEKPAARLAAGKPEKGQVVMSAYHTGPNVYIEIRDDGAGLDANVIRAKAIEKGLIEPDAKLSEQEIFKLIYLPGFSTAARVSNISGRGVGLDVVKRSIEALRGAVETESTRGAGTTIRLRLPLTLAIIEGLLVAVNDARYVLPMSMVEECIGLSAADVERANGNCLAAVRGEMVPYLRLRDWFSVDGKRPKLEQIVITSVDGFRFGLVVDHVVGQHQTVIKTLGTMYQGIDGLSGATILGDGTVALIVDVSALAEAAVSAADEERAQAGHGSSAYVAQAHTQ